MHTILEEKKIGQKVDDSQKRKGRPMISVNQKLFKMLLSNTKGMKLKLLDRVMPLVIPFNSPHCLRLQSWNQLQVEVALPLKRKNMNHLGGIHACAIALVGEYTAGLILLKNFDPNNFRLIMSKLDVDYHYQGRTDLNAKASLSMKDVHHLKEDLEKRPKASIKIKTEVVDQDQQKVATVTTHWQLKNWVNVKTGA